MTSEKFNPKIIDGDVSENKRDDIEKMNQDLQSLEWKHSCRRSDKPQWCVYGSNRFGREHGVLYWIQPSQEDEFVARRMAKMISKLGGKARAEKTEWNENLKGRVAYSPNDSFPIEDS